MEKISFKPEPSLLIEFSDETMQIELQKYPMLNGSILSAEILKTLPSVLKLRYPKSSGVIEKIDEFESLLPESVSDRAVSLLNKAGFNSQEIIMLIEKFAWKFRECPASINTVMSIGCGDGTELIFLRALAPKARIVGIDWQDNINPNIKKITEVEFIKTNLNHYFSIHKEKYDIIFSNHVLEHMYDPEKMLRLIHNNLTESGYLIAALPMDGSDGRALAIYNQLRGKINLLELGEVDFGHPWKTNPSDIKDSLLNAGYTSVRLLQRKDHLNYQIIGSQEKLEIHYKKGKILNNILIKPFKVLANYLLYYCQSSLIIKYFYSLERRFWFGSNNLKNSTAQEILVIGRI